jgi:hypothetical protein
LGEEGGGVTLETTLSDREVLLQYLRAVTPPPKSKSGYSGGTKAAERFPNHISGVGTGSDDEF